MVDKVKNFLGFTITKWAQVLSILASLCIILPMFEYASSLYAKTADVDKIGKAVENLVILHTTDLKKSHNNKLENRIWYWEREKYELEVNCGGTNLTPVTQKRLDYIHRQILKLETQLK